MLLLLAGLLGLLGGRTACSCGGSWWQAVRTEGRSEAEAEGVSIPKKEADHILQKVRVSLIIDGSE